MPLSPVLEAYFGGQKSQADLINQATEAQQRQQQLTQAQQTIDEIAKQHTFENTNSSKLLQMQLDKFKLDHDIANHTFTQDAINNMREGIIPRQTTDTPTTLQIPGVSPEGRTSPGAMLLGVNVSQVNPTQVITLPDGSNVTIPTPKTNLENALDQQRALAPGQISMERQKANIDADAYVKKMMPELNSKLATQQAISDAKIQALKDGYDIKEKIAEIGANAKVNNMLMMNGISPDPGAFKTQVITIAHQAAAGDVSGNLSQFGPILGRAAENALSSAGFVVPKAGTKDTVNGLVNDASQFLKGIDVYKQTIKTPKNLVGRATNVLADTLGISGLSPYKSVYDMLTLDQLPRLEKTLGMTPGALSRSPKLLEKIKSITPLPGDSKSTVDLKEANGADLFLSAAARQLSGLPAEQRKLFWQNIANDHPELINRNKPLRDAMIKAGSTGKYEPGSFFLDFVGNR
jgi:hypothetical protein